MTVSGQHPDLLKDTQCSDFFHHSWVLPVLELYSWCTDACLAPFPQSGRSILFSPPLFPGAERAILPGESTPVCDLGQVASWAKCEVRTRGIPGYAKAPLAGGGGQEASSRGEWLRWGSSGQVVCAHQHPSPFWSLYPRFPWEPPYPSLNPFGSHEVDPWDTWPSLTYQSTSTLWLQYLVQEGPCGPSQNFPKSCQERGTPFLGGWLSW